jgi:hypothetical protein
MGISKRTTPDPKIKIEIYITKVLTGRENLRSLYRAMLGERASYTSRYITPPHLTNCSIYTTIELW